MGDFAFSIRSQCSTCPVRQGSRHRVEVLDPWLQMLQQSGHRKCVHTPTRGSPLRLGERKVGFRGPGVESGLRQSPGVKLRLRTRHQPWCPSMKSDQRQVVETGSPGVSTQWGAEEEA